ncbi:hypothetical protein FGB62_225g05 [Gracilaria domingensis]|nr:hypothetical protein FGB62_225g05 [Gracilaria domingensis]
MSPLKKAGRRHSLRHRSHSRSQSQIENRLRGSRIDHERDHSRKKLSPLVGCRGRRCHHRAQCPLVR